MSVATADSNENDDTVRLLLLLTDILGDLNIVNQESNQLWTPESVKKEVERNGDGGLALAVQLLRSLDTTAAKNNLKTWADLHQKNTSFWPPWVSTENLSNAPTLSKLEALVFMASALQSKLLREMKASMRKENSESTAAAEDGSSSAHDKLVLPSHLSEEQQALIRACYDGFQKDYNQRKMGMQQRLDIMICNFCADNKDDPVLMEAKKTIQSMSSTSPATMTIDLNQDDLRKHFTTPHSYRLDESSSDMLKKATRADHRPAVDRGGRTDGSSSRTAMPKWVDKESPG